MEGTVDMTSNASNNPAVALAPHNKQQEAVAVSSPIPTPTPTPTKKEQTKNTKKPRAAQQAGSGEPKPRPQQDAALSCPRCRSTNTKFCYYNNYNLTQPRYFCKACRRYWTQGGTLRNVPIGGGCRRNKRTSGSSSVAAAPLSVTTAEVVNTTVSTRLMLMPAISTMSTTSPATRLFPNNNMLPALMPTTMGGSGGFDPAMDDHQGFLPFSPLSLSDQAPELAPGGSDTDTTPTFLDMLTGGYPDGAGRSSSYGAGLGMSGGSNGMEMDMPFMLPGMGSSATGPMLVEGIIDVPPELQWSASELDNYINDDGGYAGAGPAAVVHQQQQVVGGQQEEDNKATEGSKNNNDDGGSSVYSYWINTNTNHNDGAEE